MTKPPTSSHADDLKQKGQLANTANTTLLAGCLTAGLFLALPYVHVVDTPEFETLPLTSLEQTHWQTPPLPLPEHTPQLDTTEPLPKPIMAHPQATVIPLQASLDFNVELGTLGGDFSLSFTVDPALGADGLGSSIFEISDVDRAPQPLVQLQPLYPAHARMRRIEGSVSVNFVVSAEGRTRDISVLASEPGNLFNGAATRAIERWRFAPGIQNGTPVAVRVRQRIRFELED